MRLRIKIDGRTYEAEVEILDSAESAPEYPPYPPAEPTFIPASLPNSVAHVVPEQSSDKECRSPVMGLVIKVNVEVGQPVQAEEVVIVLESMKMEMQIAAPASGVVKNIFVSQGRAVKVNELMLELA
ncbi:biotin/lipoyl-containing protein [Occallatibacter savannae]|uniref:biotin/lipoyl-containing protein n=1 Tax=Occallatibacter savannae TaxID=1002691 RepID=UPI000D686134|nr:acetyl-CoA carboxylase biotin carboxyl carrier protein subunit [Occallatibacter savannae]